jgi:hypothetical protein
LDLTGVDLLEQHLEDMVVVGTLEMGLLQEVAWARTTE